MNSSTSSSSSSSLFSSVDSLLYQLRFINPQGEFIEDCSLVISQAELDELFLKSQDYREEKELPSISKERFNHLLSPSNPFKVMDDGLELGVILSYSTNSSSLSSTPARLASQMGFHTSSLSASSSIEDSSRFDSHSNSLG